MENETCSAIFLSMEKPKHVENAEIVIKFWMASEIASELAVWMDMSIVLTVLSFVTHVKVRSPEVFPQLAQKYKILRSTKMTQVVEVRLAFWDTHRQHKEQSWWTQRTRKSRRDCNSLVNWLDSCYRLHSAKDYSFSNWFDSLIFFQTTTTSKTSEIER
jgi:hypothetical protein